LKTAAAAAGAAATAPHAADADGDSKRAAHTRHVALLVAAAAQPAALAASRGTFQAALRHTAAPPTHARAPSPFTLRAVACHALAERRYQDSLALLAAAAAAAPAHALTHRALGVVTYLYGPQVNTHTRNNCTLFAPFGLIGREGEGGMHTLSHK